MIGITGGIGAGKSVVSRLLRAKGLPVYDCDSQAKRILNESPELREAIARRFGSHCIAPDGTIATKEVAKIDFHDSMARTWLNHLVHSAVREDVARFADRHPDPVFVESAIMKTSRLYLQLDAMWVVSAPEDLRILRSCRRDGADIEQVKARIDAQSSEYADFGDIPVAMIFNDDSHSLLTQVDSLLDPLLL